MNINEAHKNWTALGSEDPMWVILTDPAKKGNKWDQNDFFASGRQVIEAALEDLKAAGMQPAFDRALDFGCGLGRLSQALAERFALVDGVDVSASMIEQAKALNRHPAKVTYHLNVQEDLRGFASDSYDFIYSTISLQHTPSRFQEKYISDFVRLLKPEGVALFQTIHAVGWRKLVPNAAAELFRKLKHKGKAFIPMYGIPVETVRGVIEKRGGVIRKQQSSAFDESQGRFASDSYVVTRRSRAEGK